VAAQLNIAALPGTTTVSCGSTVSSSSDTPAAHIVLYKGPIFRTMSRL
jgi:hypothetical protein